MVSNLRERQQPDTRHRRTTSLCNAVTQIVSDMQAMFDNVVHQTSLKCLIISRRCRTCTPGHMTASTAPVTRIRDIEHHNITHGWNNGKSGAKLDLTSSTTPGLQIHKFDHTRTANPCDWLPCCCAMLLLVGYPHSLVYLHLPVVEGLIFCISATPHLGTSFPLFHDLVLL